MRAILIAGMKTTTPFALVLLFCFAATTFSQDLVVSSNRRFLQHSNGKPFFYLADAAWLMFKELSPTDIELYLNNRRDKRFTVIEITALWSIKDGFSDETFEKPKTTYWNLVDYGIGKAQSLGL